MPIVQVSMDEAERMSADQHGISVEELRQRERAFKDEYLARIRKQSEEKQVVSLRLPVSVIEKFKADGPGYTSRMAAALSIVAETLETE